jgi:putative membrane protein
VIQLLRTFVGGFLMGTADLIPGVSGGTIALVLGIYERLVNSIREGSSALGSILKADIPGFRRHLGGVEWIFLVPLLVGILTAVVTLASFLAHQLEERPTILAGVFFGLVLGSVIVAWRLLREPEPMHPVVAAVVAVTLFLILGLGGDEAAVAQPTLIAYFGAGALAICAMILPGISGSLILLLIGMYAPVLAAVNERDFLVVGVFVLGAIVGLAFFSQLLHWALRYHHDLILAALIGLMAGSLRVVWPWPEGVESAALAAPGDDWLAVTVAGIIGFAAVFLIARLAPSDADEISEPLPAG